MGAMTFVVVQAADVPTSPAVERIVDDIRARADAFVFLSGGASKMPAATAERLRALLRALAVLVDHGLRFAVGDGGTQAGLMEAAGAVRRTTGDAFPLLGVSPAPDVTTTGEPDKTPVDPNHSHVVAVDDPDWVLRQRARGWDPSQGHWGSETAAMYEIFARLARGRPSVTIVANGGAVTVDEIGRNVVQRRPMIVVAGSGRAADAVVTVLRGSAPADDSVRRLVPAVEAVGVTQHAELFEVFPLERGPDALARVLLARLRPRMR
jgi:TRPM family ion channel